MALGSELTLCLQNLSKNWVDRRGLQKTRADISAARKRWDSRTLATKDERHRHVTKYRLPGFNSRRLHQIPKQYPYVVNRGP